MGLNKDLSLVEVLAITMGAMMSSGLFVLPGLAFAQSGPSIVVAYILAALLATAGMLSQAELTSAMPKAGGTYFYVTRSMGAAVGTIYGLITFLALALKSAFELVGMAVFTVMLVKLDVRFIALGLCAVFIAVNMLGSKGAGRIQIGLVLVILASLAAYVFMGVPRMTVGNFDPFTPAGPGAIVSTAGFVFMSYGGLLKVASLAEEVKEPGRTLPLGMILSVLIVTAVYIAVVSVTIGVLGGPGMAPAGAEPTMTPVSDGAGVFIGEWGRALLSVAAVLAFISATNAGIMGASRYPYALARDELFPSAFARLNRRFNTPHFSILLTGALIAAAVFLDVKALVKAASSVLILTYLFSIIANVIMRESRLQNYQPSFKTPFYPWIQLAGIVGFGFLLFEIGLEAWLVSLGLIVLGFLFYWFYGKAGAAREYALLHCIERITARELTDHGLEEELRDILHERDEVVKDRFDRLVEEAKVIDVDEAMAARDFFEMVAEELAGELGVSREELIEKFLEREKDSSTVVAPGLAIPHIVVPGESKFTILLGRCKGGVFFMEASQRVDAIFIMAGSKDERNFHLRALAAIAQIMMDPAFEDRWLQAKSEKALRDVILLGKRRR